MIYFDNASTTIPIIELIEDFSKNSLKYFANPSSSYSLGQESKSLLNNSRDVISKILNCKSNEIIFTSGATEANNLAIKGLVKKYDIKNIISSKLEHLSVIRVLEKMQNVFYVKNDNKGILDLEDLENILSKLEGRTLISLMHVNNEIGNINDITMISTIAKKYNAFFHCDAVQSVGLLDIDLQKNNVDLLTASAHKFNGLRGAGFLFCRDNIDLEPLLDGGLQENHKRAGTENLPAIIFMQKSLEMNVNDKEKLTKLKSLKEYFMQKIKEEIKGIKFIGNLQNSSPSIINISLNTKKKIDSILLLLEMENIFVSSGSSCKSGSNQISSVIKCINEDFYPNIRISFSKENKSEEIDFFISKLKYIL